MATAFLCAAYFFLGLISITVQVLTVREFMVVFFGNELCLGIILGGWLIGIAMGSGSGCRITRRVTRIFPLFILLQAALCLLPFFQICTIRLIRDILVVPAGEYISLLPLITAAILITLPFSFTMGLIFPCACALFTVHEKKQAQHIGLVYILEAVGSLTGGAVLTFYLIAHCKPYEILAIISTLLFFNAAALCFLRTGFRYPILSWSCIALGAANAFLLLTGNFARLDDLLIQKRWDTYKNRLELHVSADSPYQNIVIASAQNQFSVFGNGQYVTSFPDPYQSSLFAHCTLSQHPAPGKILLVGGGSAGIIHEMLKYPIKLLHYVELDPLMIEVSLPYLAVQERIALDDNRVCLFFRDGRYFIQQAAEDYDMIILNLPDPSNAMLNRFYTIEFFEEAKRKLAPGGVLVTGITGSDSYLGREVGIYASSLYQTLKKVFSRIIVSPGTKNYFFATDAPGVISADPDLLARRYRSRNITSDTFTPYHFGMLFPEDRASFLAAEMERQPGVKINTDSSPITYYYNLVLWESIAGSRRRAHLFQGIAGRLDVLVLPLTILFLLRIAYVLATRKRLASHLNCNALIAIASAGFAGMALEIVLLFSFQNIYGYVYRQVGLIVALFMLGLAAGGAQMNKLISGRERSWVKILPLLSILIGVYAIGLPYILELFSNIRTSTAGGSIDLRYLFMALVAGAGWLTGLEFPLVSRIFTDRYAAGTVAGRVNAFDHLGACLGALLTGTILVPVLGVYQSCFITGALNLMSGALLLIYILQKGR